MMQKLLYLTTIILLTTGCASVSDYKQGCIDGLSVADISYQRKVDYCDSIENNRFHPKDEIDKRAGRP